MSVNEPVFVSVHERAKVVTPDGLRQSYIECSAEQKLDFIWSFITQHTKAKTIVFFATCKQVRFAYEAMRKLQPGVSLLALFGTMSQTRRVAVYDAFGRKHHSVLFATDLAARGLDFAAVRYVVQLDCPEDAVTYVHRVGRTARLDAQGEAILVLEPHQKLEMLQQLANRRCGVLDEIAVNPRRIVSVHGRLDALLAGDSELKELAKRAVVAYLKSVRFMPNRRLFDLSKLNVEAFARSFGLPNAPRIRFKLAGRSKREKVNEQCSTSDASNAKLKASALLASDDDEPILVKKNTPASASPDSTALDTTQDELAARRAEKLLTKAALAKKQLRVRKHLGVTGTNHVMFDDAAQSDEDSQKPKRKKQRAEETSEAPGIDFEERKQWMAQQDQQDKEVYRQLVKQKHKDRRAQEKLLRQSVSRARAGDDDDDEEEGEEMQVVLGTPSSSENENESDVERSNEHNEHQQSEQEDDSESDEQGSSEADKVSDSDADGNDDDDAHHQVHTEDVKRNEQLALALLRTKKGRLT